jgi:hypothetical protein
VEALRQELNIAKARHAIEFEDLRKQADYLETQKMRKFGTQKDLERDNEKLKEMDKELAKELIDIE